jgi:hypothetical protein
MLRSTTHYRDFSFSQFPNLPERVRIIAKQLAPSRGIFFNDDCAVVDSIADPVPWDA